MLLDESGTTAIEYALIGSLVAVAIVGALTVLGDRLQMFNDIWAAIAAASM